MFKQPVGLAVDDKRKRLYVVDTHLHKVFVLDLETGEVIKTIGRGERRRGIIQLSPANSPRFRWKPACCRYNKRAGFRYLILKDAFSGPLGSSATVLATLQDPKGIGIDSEGHIYVVDAAFNNVQIFNDEGQILMAFGQYGEGRG